MDGLRSRDQGFPQENGRARIWVPGVLTPKHWCLTTLLATEGLWPTPEPGPWDKVRTTGLDSGPQDQVRATGQGQGHGTRSESRDKVRTVGLDSGPQDCTQGHRTRSRSRDKFRATGQGQNCRTRLRTGLGASGLHSGPQDKVGQGRGTRSEPQGWTQGCRTGLSFHPGEAGISRAQPSAALEG